MIPKVQRRAGLVLLIVALAVVGGWWLAQRRPGSSSPTPSRLHVVTTTPILYSLTAKVLGDRGTLSNLVPPGASPENYALRPQDAEALERADVLVQVGLRFEQFLANAITRIEKRGVTVITASQGISTRLLETHAHKQKEGEEAHEEEGTSDPHVWVDPLRAIQMVRTIAEGLAVADPEHAGEYREGAEIAVRDLEALHQEFVSRLTAVPQRAFIAFHPAWGYFAERYGLQQVAVIEEIPGAEPTAQELAELVDTVRRTGVRALLSEPQFSPKIVTALARDLDLKVYEVNPEGGELAEDGYERLMRANVAVFVRALSGS